MDGPIKRPNHTNHNKGEHRDENHNSTASTASTASIRKPIFEQTNHHQFARTLHRSYRTTNKREREQRQHRHFS